MVLPLTDERNLAWKRFRKPITRDTFFNANNQLAEISLNLFLCSKI